MVLGIIKNLIAYVLSVAAIMGNTINEDGSFYGVYLMKVRINQIYESSMVGNWFIYDEAIIVDILGDSTPELLLCDISNAMWKEKNWEVFSVVDGKYQNIGVFSTIEDERFDMGTKIKVYYDGNRKIFTSVDFISGKAVLFINTLKYEYIDGELAVTDFQVNTDLAYEDEEGISKYLKQIEEQMKDYELIQEIDVSNSIKLN